MKKTVLSMVIFLLIFGTLLADIQQPSQQAKELPTRATRPNEQVRYTPEVEFITAPIDLITSFYDYFPGGYNRNPLIIQPETTSTGYPAGGVYIGFQARESAAASSQRRIYFAYINAEGQLVQRSTVSTDNAWEGFPGTDVDPVTGNPIIAYHRTSPDGTYDCYMSYDLYHLLAAPGAWKTPFICINNPDVSLPFTGHNDDEFIWPKVAIGPSPIAGKSRVYIYGDNSASNSGGVANYNIIIGKADFDGDTMAAQMDLEFEYTTIPELDDFHYNDIDRAIKDLAISDDGQVAFVGWYGHNFFVVYSDDYGDTYSFIETSGRWDLDNPQNSDGTYYFMNDDATTPATIFAYPSSDGGHFNAQFVKNNSKVICMGAFGINNDENLANDMYMPAMFYPKIYEYTIQDGELDVNVIDLYITGLDAYDGNPMIPWDLNEDGVVDEFTTDGSVGFVASVPSHYYAGDAQTAFFHESNFKVSTLDNWAIAVWQDAENVYFNYYEEPGYGDWAELPEIMIAVSNDYGETWSEPAKMNAKANDVNYYSELNGMIPAYVYPADQLEVIDETHAKVHLLFLDDYSYGSFIQAAGTNAGGMVSYACISVEIPLSSGDQTDLPTASALLFNNYPNPFNPDTNIKFETKETDNVTLEIYNVKGQKIVSLVNEVLPAGTHTIQWNGEDSSNNPVSSGVYFYKLRSGRYTATKKMILMK